MTLTSPDATGVTDDATLEVSVDAVSRLSTHLLQQLTGVGLRAAVSNAITAHPAGVIRGRDLGHSGTISARNLLLRVAALAGSESGRNGVWGERRGAEEG